jgi:hypothetical protein
MSRPQTQHQFWPAYRRWGCHLGHVYDPGETVAPPPTPASSIVVTVTYRLLTSFSNFNSPYRPCYHDPMNSTDGRLPLWERQPWDTNAS